jgi:NhaP-type Na+/H+ or K+/H+ antiporter
MSIISYLFVVIFYILGGFCIHILIRRILSHLATTKTKTVNAISVSVAVLLTFVGVGLSTFVFLTLHTH